MISRQHIEEGLSRAYVQAVAARAGINLTMPLNDYGVDGTFRKVIRSHHRLYESGFSLDYQLKASTRWQLEKENVVYDLEAKTYNDLVLRSTGNATPLLLLLVCLPKEPRQWLECTEAGLLLRGCCYWDFVRGKVTKNLRTVRIRIPRSQQFTPNVIANLLKRAERRGQQ